MRVVVVGSGLAGVTVAEALAKHYDVCLLTAETHGYYARPRLSHGFSSDARIVLKSFDAMAPVRVLAGTRVIAIDRENQHLELEAQNPLAYDTLVLATGSAARIPPVLLPFRPDDRPARRRAHRLRDRLRPQQGG